MVFRVTLDSEPGIEAICSSLESAVVDSLVLIMLEKVRLLF